MTKDLSWLRTLPGNPLVVAEVKDRTPFNATYSAPDRYVQLRICEDVGDIISIHTNPLWGGSWEWLTEVCMLTTKPVLAKGFHDTVVDVQRALDCGATHVLTVGWDGGPHWERCWMECENLAQLRLQRRAGHRCVWNARDPRTGATRDTPWTGGWDSVMACNGDRRRDPWICQASHIRGPQHVVPGVSAILIGTGLYS